MSKDEKLIMDKVKKAKKFAEEGKEGAVLIRFFKRGTQFAIEYIEKNTHKMGRKGGIKDS